MTPDDLLGSRYEISGNVYYAALLHDHPQLLDSCCELINMEWKRSHVARLRSIGGSSDKFPTSIILLKENGKPKIVGHCKLSKLSYTSPVIFVDTVVIHPDLRGKGLGKLLMQKAEEYLKSKQIEWIYLTTMGQELFYEKLGYLVCEPISIYGGQLNFVPQEVDVSEMNSGLSNLQKESSKSDKHLREIVMDQQSFAPSSTIPMPPPPPPPPPLPSENKIVCVNSKKTFMRKKII